MLRRNSAAGRGAEARITYRFHPRFGEMVQIRRRLESGGFEFVVVLQPDGSFASLPAWMTEPAASRFEIGDEPHFPKAPTKAGAVQPVQDRSG